MSKKRKRYFGRATEVKVAEYLTASTRVEQEIIFNDFLYTPFSRLIESIMFTYGLQLEGEDLRDVKHDVFSFVITKFTKFDPSRTSPTSGKPVKAFSYFGTIIKRYLIQLNVKKYKEKVKNKEFDSMTQSESSKFCAETVLDDDDPTSEIVALTCRSNLITSI